MKEAIGPFRVFDDSPEDNFYRCLNMIQKQPSLCQRFSFNDLLLPNVTNRIRKYLKLSHQYLSKIVDFQLSTKHQTVSVFYESENLSLEEIISNINFFDTNFIISIAYQLLSVLRYLHSNDFSHRNINLNNIFLTKNDTIKLANFEISENICFSKFDEYLPPEYFLPNSNFANENEQPKNSLQNSDSKCAEKIDENSCVNSDSKENHNNTNHDTTKVNYDGKKADIWSAGIAIYAMTFGTIPWTYGMNPDYHHEELIQQICSGNIPLPDYGENMEKIINQLLFPMLNPDPCQRPNADELLKYHIFDKIQLQEKQKSVKKPNVLKKFFDSILEEIQENKK